MKRGKLLEIEGTDGLRKETQSEKWIELMNLKNILCASVDFPQYNSPSGGIVD